jgi:hypothetical protein
MNEVKINEGEEVKEWMPALNEVRENPMKQQYNRYMDHHRNLH